MNNKRTLKFILSIVLLILTILLWHCTPSPPPPTSWPVNPVNSEHEIGNSAGEFQQYGSKPARIHDGLDIMIKPAHPDPSSPDLKAVREGRLWFFRDPVGDRPLYHGLILNVGDIKYRYGHVDENSIPSSFPPSFTTGGEGAAVTVTAGQNIGKVVGWPDCDYHHIHFEIVTKDLSIYFNPLLFLQPRDDDSNPKVRNIRFFKQVDPTIEFTIGTPIQVLGSVDIVAEIHDTIFSTRHTGIYSFSYTVDEVIGEHDMTVSYHFSTIPIDKVDEVYRVADCKSDLCGTDTYNYIVTNVVDGEINTNGCWNTAETLENGQPKFPNGIYKVIVKARDVSGNSGELTVQVEVKN